jgi:hypothetical protein
MTDDRDGTPHPHDEDTEAMDLEHLLRQTIARADPVPRSVVRYGVEAYTLRSLDEELAELAWDSWVDEGVLTRGPGEARLLTFGPAGPRDVLIHLAVTRGETGYELTGHVQPAAYDEISVLYRGGSARRPVDPHGRFGADIPAVTSIRLRLQGAAAAPVVTGWVPID